jgi:hypothetical protein
MAGKEELPKVGACGWAQPHLRAGTINHWVSISAEGKVIRVTHLLPLISSMIPD